MPCNGSGLFNGGSHDPGDGIFYTASKTRFGDIVDGTTNTALVSESLLGPGNDTPTGPLSTGSPLR